MKTTAYVDFPARNLSYFEVKTSLLSSLLFRFVLIVNLFVASVAHVPRLLSFIPHVML